MAPRQKRKAGSSAKDGASGGGPAPRSSRSFEALYNQILDSSTDNAIIATDRQGTITAWNSGAENIFGWSSAAALGQSADILFTPEDQRAGAPAAEMRRADAELRAADKHWYQRRDGSQFWGQGMMTPLSEGSTLGYLKILHDRTNDRESAERQRVLLSELQHRVRNILAVVRSLATRTLEKSESLAEFGRNFDGRLAALARTQNILTRNGDVSVELGELVADELLSAAARDGDQVRVEGPVVRLRQGPAEAVALAIHELTTNALKYGALSHPNATLTVTWRVTRSRKNKVLALEWREHDVPAVDLNPVRSGFGRELIERALPYELGATTELEFAAGGVRALIAIPIDDKTAFIPTRKEARR